MAEPIRFYADEHIGRSIVLGLRRRGVDVLTVSEAGMRSASDQEHLRFAFEQRRVIITQDDDFLRFHAQGMAHWGIVYASHYKTVGEIIRGVMLIYHILSPEDMYNHVEFI